MYIFYYHSLSARLWQRRNKVVIPELFASTTISSVNKVLPIDMRYFSLILLRAGDLVATLIEELEGPAVSALRREIAEVRQRWSLDG
jgi:hypothetical protein